jgi:CMP-N,N'-diacetyllegionaminic acid synthase
LKNKYKDTLFVIPARGGSKGIPGKNIKMLAGRPLIGYSINAARQLVDDARVYVSTDSQEIINVVSELGYKVPFKRPDELAGDRSDMREVLLHAIDFAEKSGFFPETVVLLQPTSPFRKIADIENAFDLYTHEFDMVVSVKESDANPYYVLFEEDDNGELFLSKPGNFTRRQDCPPVYQYNGCVYVINIDSLRRTPMNQFKKVKKYEMSTFTSVDIDKPEDWDWAEYLIEKKLVKLDA